VQPAYRPRRIRLRDGREVTQRAVAPSDAAEIVQAFERLSAQSRYNRFMQHTRQIDAGLLQRGVNPRPGRDYVFVATVPAPDDYDIVGAAQYQPAGPDEGDTCEFAITVAEDWRGSGLATRLLASLVRRARRDGFKTMEGWVLAENRSMLALARKLGFKSERLADDASVVRVHRAL
jgi:RimJ/RimL family protein N-acetyltransferase